MSNPARKLRRNAARRAASTAARLSGCTCRPDVVMHGTARASVAHDHWCPMVDHGSQLVVFPLPEGCER